MVSRDVSLSLSLNLSFSFSIQVSFLLFSRVGIEEARSWWSSALMLDIPCVSMASNFQTVVVPAKGGGDAKSAGRTASSVFGSKGRAILCSMLDSPMEFQGEGVRQM